MQRKQSGFTLVEIAIVLVIIGLLLGGILKGQEMITQAKIKNVISDFNGISAAQYAYQDRYRAIPGDDSGAGTRWTVPLAYLGAAAGNGDGVLTGAYNNTPTTPLESNLYWNELRLAGFVSGQGGVAPQGAQQPQNAASGTIGVQTGNAAAGQAMASGGGGFSGLIMCSAGLPDKIAIAVDTQLDDGINATGTVRAQIQTTPNPAINAALVAGDAYVENGTNTYTLCKSL
jgi:prepilin-type N-terminal cleavage/methylation domain-containing protein